MIYTNSTNIHIMHTSTHIPLGGRNAESRSAPATGRLRMWLQRGRVDLRPSLARSQQERRAVCQLCNKEVTFLFIQAFQSTSSLRVWRLRGAGPEGEARLCWPVFLLEGERQRAAQRTNDGWDVTTFPTGLPGAEGGSLLSEMICFYSRKFRKRGRNWTEGDKR